MNQWIDLSVVRLGLLYHAQLELDQYAGKTTGTCDKSVKLGEGYDT